MPIERARRRAMGALEKLRTAQKGAVAGEINVDLVCDALLDVRDLLMITGNEGDSLPWDQRRLAALQFLAHDMPTLILALEVTAVRADTMLKVHGGALNERKE